MKPQHFSIVILLTIKGFCLFFSAQLFAESDHPQMAELLCLPEDKAAEAFLKAFESDDKISSMIAGYDGRFKESNNCNNLSTASPLDPFNINDRPFSTSGGWYNWPTLQHNYEGHYEYSWYALKHNDVTYCSANCVEAIADASRDADFFFWETAAAHAQTPNNSNGKPTESVTVAMNAFHQWVAKYTKMASNECKNGEPKKSLFYLGIAIHAIQDLIPHDGRTNAEHSWLDTHGKSPDLPNKLLERIARIKSTQATRLYMDKVAIPLFDGCFQKTFESYPKSARYWFFQKDDAFNLERDLTIKSYKEYKAFGKKSNSMPYKKIRWLDKVGVCEQLSKICLIVNPNKDCEIKEKKCGVFNEKS